MSIAHAANYDPDGGHPDVAPSLIRARGVVKAFGEGMARVQVLFGIDVDLYGGEMTFVVGESGSGKTTLISILSALLTPDQGELEILGQPLEGSSVTSLARFRRESIGFVFQQFNLLSVLTAAENAAVPLLAAGVPRTAAIARARALLARLGLADHADKLPNALSGGQQQRVAIARALVHAPRIVVCDEPTASLDARSGREVMTLLRDIAVQAGRAVLVVTHDNRIFSYADRMLELEDGRLVADRRGPFSGDAMK